MNIASCYSICVSHLNGLRMRLLLLEIKKLFSNIKNNGCHVGSIAPFCHIAFYMTLKDENALQISYHSYADDTKIYYCLMTTAPFTPCPNELMK